MTARVGLLLGIAFLVLAHASSSDSHAGTLPMRSLFRKSEEFGIKQGQTEYRLQFWPILSGTVEVYLKAPKVGLQQGSGYLLHAEAGILELLDEKLAGTLVVMYDVLPFSVERIYGRDLFGSQETDTPAAQAIPSTLPGQTEVEPQLEVTGTKTFSVGLGSERSLTPNQSLRLNVSGQISSDVRVLAILSDQDLPFQSEGTTESIQDIDQKLVRVESPHFTATLGDFEAQLGGSDISFPRALQGAQVDVRVPWAELRLIPSAIPEGLSSSKTFQGIEGQNSYRADVAGQYIVMKQGTDVVWLNGERMRRGEENDYIIQDYGDPIVEFTSKHLITGHDVIRVDFEYIPEDLNYRQSLAGFSGSLLFPDNRGKLGVSYATEADDASTPFILLTDEELAALADDIRELGGRGLPTPEKHSVLGFDGSYQLAHQTHAEARWALSSLDANRFSDKDRIEQQRAWDIGLRSDLQWFRADLTWRHQDAQFMPVGATLANRNRFQYEQQYSTEQFEDLFLLGQSTSATPTEDNYDASFLLSPLSWLTVKTGFGQTSEDYAEDAMLQDTTRRNWNIGVKAQPKRLPHLRYEQYMNSTQGDGVLDFEKSRQLWDLSYQMGKTRWNVFRERTLTLDRNLKDSFNRNRRRERQGGRAEWQQSSSVRFSTELSREFSYVRDDLFPVDGLPLDFGPWQRSETARTGTVGLTLRPTRWLDASGNFARRILVQEESGDLQTNLAEFQARVAPWQRALDLRLHYEIDKKLETEKEEIYTNILFDRELEPGEGTHVRLDEYHYQRDSENGNYVRLLRTLGDRPVASVEASVQFSLVPARAASMYGYRADPSPTTQDGAAPRPTPSPWHQAVSFLRRSVDASIRWEVIEEQENAGTTDLYLLRNLQALSTLLGRSTLRYRVGFAPLDGLRLEANHSDRGSLDGRFDSRKRVRDSDEARYLLDVDISRAWSVQATLEKRQSSEQLTDLGLGGSGPLLVSDLSQEQRTETVSTRYRWNMHWDSELEFQHESESARDPLADEGTTDTQTYATESRLSYAWPGKGRLSLNYRAAWGRSQGDLAVARYNFYDGLSHELRCQLEYRTQQFTDLLWRVNYRLRITEQEKPDHRAQMEVAAEL